MNQLGTGLIRKSAPTFADYIVVDGTWKEKDSTMHERTEGGDGLVANYSFWRPGVDCAADLVIKAGEVAPKIGDVLTSTETSPRSFVVLGADISNFGGKPLKVAVQLAYHDDFTPTVVS